jgi:hypothetical protein
VSGTLDAPAGPATGAGDHGPRQRPPGALVAVVVVLAAVGVAALSLVALRADGADGVTVDRVRAGQSTGQAAAVYLELTPDGGDDSLVGASSPVARRVSLHEAEVTDGLTTMRVTDRIPVRDGDTTALEPGGSHLMLEVLDEPLEPDDRFELTLEFARSGTRTVEVTVVPLADLLEEP